MRVWTHKAPKIKKYKQNREPVYKRKENGTDKEMKNKNIGLINDGRKKFTSVKTLFNGRMHFSK